MQTATEINFRQYLYYFSDKELLGAVTNGKIASKEQLDTLLAEKAVGIKEDELAKNLLSQEPARVVTLLPQYLAALECMKSDTPEKPNPARPDLQFSHGAPTWLRLAWKCRTSFEKIQATANAITDEKCLKIAGEFFEKHSEAINAQANKKAAHTICVRELFPDNEATNRFFAVLCGKPNAHAPYATNKLLANNLFANESPATFDPYMRFYATCLAESRVKKIHPEIVEDLIKRLQVAILDPKNSAKLEKLSESTKETFEALKTSL